MLKYTKYKYMAKISVTICSAVLIIAVMATIFVTYSLEKNDLKQKSSNQGIQRTSLTPKASTSPFLFIPITPSAILPSGWKTYSDPLHCYSFSLPANWKVTYQQMYPAPNSCYGEGVMKATFEEGGQVYSLTFSIGQGGRGTLPNEHITTKQITISREPYEIVTNTYNGQTAPYDLRAFPNQTKFRLLPVVEMGGYKGLPSSNAQYYINLFEKILSTLLFNN